MGGGGADLRFGTARTVESVRLLPGGFVVLLATSGSGAVSFSRSGLVESDIRALSREDTRIGPPWAVWTAYADAAPGSMGDLSRERSDASSTYGERIPILGADRDIEVERFLEPPPEGLEGRSLAVRVERAGHGHPSLRGSERVVVR